VLDDFQIVRTIRIPNKLGLLAQPPSNRKPGIKLEWLVNDVKTDRVVIKSLFRADWRNAAFIHFTIRPDLLQPLVPLELDLYDDTAFVTLVAFMQRDLRPALGGRIGALLAKPLASHEFLNLRTYVRRGEVRGIYFLAEWIPSRLAAFVGPRTYGLPYRLGSLTYDFDFAGGKLAGEVVADGRVTFRASFDRQAPWNPSAPQSLDAFLLERYTAFTCRNNRLRRFDVDHAPWPQQPLELQIDDLTLLASCGSWTSHLEFAGAHVSPGVSDVAISAPRS
jgi:uncharacterized protein YqjF (DUF2071 family)